MSEVNIEAAAKLLRNAAEMTAGASENWDNFEGICVNVLEQVVEKVEGEANA